MKAVDAAENALPMLDVHQKPILRVDMKVDVSKTIWIGDGTAVFVCKGQALQTREVR
jgi:hypothetical protein